MGQIPKAISSRSHGTHGAPIVLPAAVLAAIDAAESTAKNCWAWTPMADAIICNARLRVPPPSFTAIAKILNDNTPINAGAATVRDRWYKLRDGLA